MRPATLASARPPRDNGGTMTKPWRILPEFLRLLARHKLYFLTPIVLVLVLLLILLFVMGPSAAVAFLYAGI